MVFGGLVFFDDDFLHDIALTNGVDNILPIKHLAEYGVFAVEVWLGRVGDEELAAVCVRAGICHGDDTGLMFEWVVPYLVFKFVPWPARASSQRIAALDHEVGDHAVEFESVVKALLCEKHKVIDGFRRVVWVQFEDDIAFIGLDGDTIVFCRVDLHIRRFNPLLWRHENVLSCLVSCADYTTAS